MSIKKCGFCKTAKPLINFQKISKNSTDFSSRCKSCGDVDFYKREQRQLPKLKQYGLSYNDYQYMIYLQENRCAICNKHQNTLSVTMAIDHCHDSGQVRGLLCSSCNLGLGNFKDNPENLQAAIQYLNAHSKRSKNE